ncbi:MAG: hypothetical protein MJY58_04330 [Bacteroidaceae bacterium]|nr:hypothetical protein [Bacteroidaceae bacterium]
MKNIYTNPQIKVIAIHSGTLMQTSTLPDNLDLIYSGQIDGYVIPD